MTSIRCRVAATPAELNHSFTLHYLAEGAANLIFSIRPRTASSPNDDNTKPTFVFVGPRNIVYPRSHFPSHVLRLSKGLSKTPSSQKNMYDFETVIEPLFDTRQSRSSTSGQNFLENLMEMSLVALEKVVIEDLNDELQRYGTRWKGPLPEAVKTGLVMEDMSAVRGSSVTIEVKPKWLAQSKNAPAGARRCRNCALRAWKSSRKSGKKKEKWVRGKLGPWVCPMHLAAGKKEVVEWLVERKVREQFHLELERTEEARGENGAASEVASKSKPKPLENIQPITTAITTYLTTGPGQSLLQHLRTKQTELDPLGVLHPTAAEGKYKYNLRLAMTLRDCSLYIQCQYDQPEFSIVAKLGDLDFKSAEKFEDWRAKERELVDGGWYLGEGEGMQRCCLAEVSGAS